MASRKSKKKTSKRKSSKKKTSKRKPKKSSSSRSRGRIHEELLADLPEIKTVRVKSKKKPKAAQPDDDEKRDPLDIERIMTRLDNTYLDEIGALLLLALGILSLVVMVSPSGGTVGGALATWLTRSFGFGAYIVALSVMAGGILLLLPKIGILIVPNWWRVIWGEVFFVAALAYYMASVRFFIGGEAGKVEVFARAIEGRGGGMVGWAIQEALHAPLGDLSAGVVLLAVLAFSGGKAFGLRAKHINTALQKAQVWLNAQADRLLPEQPAPAPPPQPAPAPAVVAPVQQVTAQPTADVVPTPQPITAVEEKTAPQPQEEKSNPAALAAAASPVEKPAEETQTQPTESDTEAKVTTQAPPPSSETGPRLGRVQTIEERIADLRRAGEFKERFEVDRSEEKRKVRKRSEDLPPLEILTEADYERPADDIINYNALLIEKTIDDFGMQVEVVDVKTGPSVTQYAVQPFTHIEKDGKKVVQRVRVTRVASLGQDISLALSARSVRIQAPVPGTNYIGVEVPNRKPGLVSLRPVIESPDFYDLNSRLGLALGRQVDGTAFAADLSKMPHLLIGGTTGSGKSVALRSIATCLVMNNTPDQLRLILIDPKMVEMIRFNGLPHLLGKVEVQVDRAIGVLRWVTREMERRYKLMEEAQSRNIFVYNKGRWRKNRLPHIVVIIDELAELMNEYGDQTEHLITRLAQMARATGIHLVVATQRPSTDVITGLIKANFPARMAFAVASNTDSRVIIDSVGAEELIGQGDMLFQAADAAGPIRLQGCFVSDEEIEKVVRFWEEGWIPEEEVKKKKIAPWERALTRASILSRTDPLLEDAIELVQQEREASASMIQRKINVGYPRAGRLIDMLEQLGVVGEDPGGGRTRTVLLEPDADVTDYLIDHGELLD